MVDKNESTMKWKVDIADMKAAMADARRAISLANAEFKTATAGIDEWSKSTDGLEAKISQLNKILPQQRKILEQMEAQYALVAKEMGADSAEAQKLAIQVENQRGAVAKTEAQISKYSAELKNMRDSSDQTQAVVGKLKTTLTNVGKAAAEAAAAGLAAFTAAATAAVTALGKMTVEAAAFADEILTTSTVTGLSAQTLQEYSYAAELLDVSLDTVTGALARNTRGMASAAEGSGAYADAYARLGISVTDANGELRDSEEVFWEAIDALGNIENATERDALAMQLFGKSAQDLNPLIAQGSAGFAELADEAQRMGAVLTDEQLGDLGAFDDAIQRLKAGSEAGKRALGLILLPALQDLSTEGVDLIGEFTRGIIEADGDWTAIGDVVGRTVAGFTTIITDQIPKFMELGTTIIKSLAGAIVKALPGLASALADALPVLVGGFAEMLPEIMSVGGEVIVQLMLGIAEALPQLIEMLPEIIIGIVTTLIEYLPQILDAGVQILVALVQGIGSVLGMLWAKVAEIGAGIIDGIRAIPGKVVSIGKNIVEGIWSGISNGTEWIKNKIRSWVGNVTDFFKRIFGIASPSKVMADEIGRWLPAGMAEGFEEDMPEALASMKQTLGDAVGELKGSVSLSADALKISADGTPGGGAAAAGQVVNFTQNNYSPKALDRLTLYRQTNGLLFSAKVGLQNV